LESEGLGSVMGMSFVVRVSVSPHYPTGSGGSAT
jgi:hypothetical protein